MSETLVQWRLQNPSGPGLPPNYFPGFVLVLSIFYQPSVTGLKSRVISRLACHIAWKSLKAWHDMENTESPTRKEGYLCLMFSNIMRWLWVWKVFKCHQLLYSYKFIFSFETHMLANNSRLEPTFGDPGPPRKIKSYVSAWRPGGLVAPPRLSHSTWGAICPRCFSDTSYNTERSATCGMGDFYRSKLMHGWIFHIYALCTNLLYSRGVNNCRSSV